MVASTVRNNARERVEGGMECRDLVVELNGGHRVSSSLHSQTRVMGFRPNRLKFVHFGRA